MMQEKWHVVYVVGATIEQYNRDQRQIIHEIGKIF